MSSFPNVSPPDADVLAELGVSAAAAAIRAGDVSSDDYASALLARARAKGAHAPLLGVPLAVKDSYLTRGLRTTLGVSTLKGYVPEKDASIVRTLRQAGGIVFGKNNLVEMS